MGSSSLQACTLQIIYAYKAPYMQPCSSHSKYLNLLMGNIDENN